MASLTLCDKFGFFNGIYGIEQTNWANYWKGIIPDGVLAGYGNEMMIYMEHDGYSLTVLTGEAMVDNHRVWITSNKPITLDSYEGTPRYDLITLRIIYGNKGASKAVIAVRKGTGAATIEDAQIPECVQESGTEYEIPLAAVPLKQNYAVRQDIIDLRFVYRFPDNKVLNFTSTTDDEQNTPYVVCINDNEYRYNTAVSSLNIYLPNTPVDTFISSVCFTSSEAFSGINFFAYQTASSSNYESKLLDNIQITPRIAGDPLTLVDKRYNLIIWWDGDSYWCASKAVA